MSAQERQMSSAAAAELVDPLLKDLSEKKQHFRQSVVLLASELEVAHRRLASQEHSFAKETLSRQKAESRAKTMEEEISILQKNLDERTEQLQASTSAAEMYAKELDDLRLQLTATKAIADARALSAQSAQERFSSLLNEIDEKSRSQMHLKNEVSRIEHEIMQANKHCNLAKILDDSMYKVFTLRDEEITELRDEIRIMSSHWKLQDEEMESELEKQHRADQELRKRVLKLEFCLYEGLAQTRKLQRMEDRKYRALKELRDELVAKQPCPKQKFWESSGFKIVVSMSMLILVMLTKR